MATRTQGGIKVPVVACAVPYRCSPGKSTRHSRHQVPAASHARSGDFPAALNIAELQLCRALAATERSGAGRLDHFSMEAQGTATSQLLLREHELSEAARWVVWVLLARLRHGNLRAFLM